MDAAGNAMAVWHQHDGMRFSIWVNRYTVGTGWGTAQLIETDNADDAEEPKVAIDADGNAIVVWAQSDGTRANIWTNRYTADVGWGRAQLIESNDSGDAARPQIAIDADGAAIAVWEQYSGAHKNIWANRYTAAAGWGTAQLIETNNAGDARYPQVGMDAGGNAIVVWQQDDGTHFNIWANRYSAAVGWSTALLIETNSAGDAFGPPQVAIDVSGNATVVWYQSDGTRYNIWANRFAAGSGWAGARLIETNYGEKASRPQIAMDAVGNAMAVWIQYDGTRDNIWANYYNHATGQGWGKARLIESANAGSAHGP